MNDADHLVSNQGKHTIKIGLLNARSVRNKAGLIRELFMDEKLQILALTETWLKDGDESIIDDLCPSGFTFIGEHRPDGKRGGGIGFVLKNGTIAKPHAYKYETFEALSIILKGTPKSHITVLYRPPKSTENGYSANDFLQEIELLLSDLSVNHDHVYVVGDFNVPFGKVNDTTYEAMKRILSGLGLHQVVNEQTHTHGNTLDWVILRENDKLELLQVDHHHCVSDHSLVSFSIVLDPECRSQPPISVRSLRRMNMPIFLRDIEDGLGASLTSEASLDESLSAFNEALRTALDTHAPVKVVHPKGSTHKGWYDDEINEERLKRRRLERKFKKTKLEIHFQMWKEQCRTVVHVINQKKRCYYHNKLTNASSKEAFTLIDQLLVRDRTMVIPSKLKHQILTEKFSEFFRLKIDRIREALDSLMINSNQTDVSNCRSTFDSFSTVSEQDIKKLILSSRPKTCALDPVPTALLKQHEVLALLLPHLTRLVNQSLTSGMVPQALKVAQVIPRLKKPTLDPDVLQNYRPVSNIPFVSKILEKIVVEQLNSYLAANDLHDKYQSAYKARHSTETAMLKIKTDIESFIDQGDAALLVMLDLSAAFDTVDHAVLLRRVEKELGIRGIALTWLCSYLQDRKQYVSIRDANSRFTDLDVGVPQGSVIGPILYLLYTIPIKRIAERFPAVSRHCYADDTQLYCRLPSRNRNETLSAVQEINTCVDQIRRWLLNNRLMINDSKTEAIILGSKKTLSKIEESDIKICVGGTYITPSSSVRNLGVMLDNNLSMERQVATATRSAYFHLRRIRLIRSYLTNDACAKAISACVTSRLDYGNVLLLGCTERTKKQLQVAQNNAARVLACIRDRREHISPTLKELHWLPIEARIIFKTLMIIHCAIHSSDFPFYLCSFVEFYSPQPSLRSARDNFILTPTAFNNCVGRNAFNHKGFKLWNDLPFHLRSMQSTCSFKRHLKTHLFNCFYS